MNKRLYYGLYIAIGILSLTLILGLVLPKAGSSKIDDNILANLNLDLIGWDSISFGPDSFIRHESSFLMDYQGDKVPANTDRILDVLKAVKNMEITGIASTNAETYTSLHVDESSAYKISLKKGSETNAYFFSKSSPDGWYFRKEGDVKVYTIASGLDSFSTQTSDYWVDSTWIKGLNKKDISTISIKGSNKDLSFTLVQNQETSRWEEKGGKLLSSEDADSLLRNFTSGVIRELVLSPDLGNLTLEWSISVSNKDNTLSADFEVYKEHGQDTLIIVPGFKPLSESGKKIAYRIAPWMLGENILLSL